MLHLFLFIAFISCDIQNKNNWYDMDMNQYKMTLP